VRRLSPSLESIGASVKHEKAIAGTEDGSPAKTAMPRGLGCLQSRKGRTSVSDDWSRVSACAVLGLSLRSTGLKAVWSLEQQGRRFAKRFETYFELIMRRCRIRSFSLG
jgi:hypothetical protein